MRVSFTRAIWFQECALFLSMISNLYLLFNVNVSMLFSTECVSVRKHRASFSRDVKVRNVRLFCALLFFLVFYQLLCVSVALYILRSYSVLRCLLARLFFGAQINFIFNFDTSNGL